VETPLLLRRSLHGGKLILIRRIESRGRMRRIDQGNPCLLELRPFDHDLRVHCQFAATYMNCVWKTLTDEPVLVAILTFGNSTRGKWNMENLNYNFKIVVLGDPGVGKTSLVKVFATGKFDRNYIPTLGVNILTKDVIFKNLKVTLVIWDLAGQGFMDNVRAQYYTGAQAAIMVYDITKDSTLNGILAWNEECKKFAPNILLKTVVGNKVDLASERKVSANDGLKTAKRISAEFFETSALSGQNVETMFNSCGRDLMKNHLAFLEKKVSILQGKDVALQATEP